MKKLGLFIAATLVSASSMAQLSESGYFSKGYTYSHELNPAFNAGQGYVSMPILGNMNLGVRGDLNMGSFLYSVDGKTTTFMNPKVSTEEVLSNIKDLNKLSFDLKMTIFSLGFKGFGGYNTLSLNAHSNFGISLPGSLFRLAKEGVENKSYDLSGLNAKATGYAEIALGHSRKITEQLTIGAKAKVLLGGTNIEAKLNKAQLDLNEEGSWDVEADAELSASLKGGKFKTEMSDHNSTPREHVSGFDVDGAGLNGFGMAFDLGAEYEIMEGLSVSAAITDLGFINWKNKLVAKSYDNNKVTTDSYLFNVDDEASNNFEDEMEKFTDDLAALADLQDKGDQGSFKQGLGSTMRIGVEYKMPFYDKLSVGLLNTTRFQKDYGWTDFRLSANVAPINAISIGANFAMGTYGTSFGWIVDIHPKGFNLFVSMDHTMGKVSKQFVPLSSNTDINFGLNFPF